MPLEVGHRWREAGPEFNVLILNGDTTQWEFEAFRLDSKIYGKITKDLSSTVEYVEIGPDKDLLDILILGRFFSSRGEAKRNGWGPEIPPGYSSAIIGKLHRGLYILNPIHMDPCEKCGGSWRLPDLTLCPECT